MKILLPVENWIESVKDSEEIKKSDVNKGDKLIITTTNSTYTFNCLGDNKYMANGGYFDKRGYSPCEVTINGCTFGGSMIQINVVAKIGMFLETWLEKQYKTMSTGRIQSVKLRRRNE